MLGGAFVVLTLILLSGGGYHLLHGTPDWYQPSTLTQAEREAAANRVDQKFADALSWAAQAQADETRQRNAASSAAPASTRPANLKTFSFTEDELNAAFQKWSELRNWKANYERFATDLVLALRDGRIIVAGKVKDFDALASLHFEPQLTPEGQLNFKLVRILGGKLPLPEAMFGSYRDRAINSLQSRLPAWQRGAQIAPNGGSNDSAVAATMARLALQVLHHEPGEPVIFLPVADAKPVPVKLNDVTIEDKTLTLSVVPLNAPEREALLQRIRDSEQETVAASGR